MWLTRRQALGATFAAWMTALRPAWAASCAEPDPYDALLTTSPGALDVEVPASAIAGALPAALRGGAFVVNGPGQLRVGGRTLHPFDGHGYLRRLLFTADGGVSLRARFVQTQVYNEESAAGGLLFPGLGSLVADPGTRAGRQANRGAGVARNVANTTLTPWAGRWLAGWEGGWPHAVDPHSLETLGPEPFGGVLAEGEAMLAHARVDPDTGRLVGLCPRLGRGTALRLIELEPPGSLARELRAEVEHPMLLHDFALTPRWVVLVNNPLRVDLGAYARAVRGRGTLLEAVQPDLERPAELLLWPRDGGPLRRLALDRPCFVVHYANAWDLADGGVEVDLCAFEQLSMGQEFGYQGPDAPLCRELARATPLQTLVRLRADPARGTVQRQAREGLGVDFPRVVTRWEGRCEGPMVAGVRTPGARDVPFDALGVYDQADPERPPALWRPGEGVVLGEPVLAHPPGDPSALTALVMAHEPARGQTRLVALDPARPEAGPVAAAALPSLPYGFHGAWVEAPG